MESCVLTVSFKAHQFWLPCLYLHSYLNGDREKSYMNKMKFKKFKLIIVHFDKKNYEGTI